jgi:hypothetical protein
MRVTFRRHFPPAAVGLVVNPRFTPTIRGCVSELVAREAGAAAGSSMVGVGGKDEGEATSCRVALWLQACGLELATVTPMWVTHISNTVLDTSERRGGKGRPGLRWVQDDAGNVSLEYVICALLLGVVGVSQFINSVGPLFVAAYSHHRDCLYTDRSDVCLRQSIP